MGNPSTPLRPSLFTYPDVKWQLRSLATSLAHRTQSSHLCPVSLLFPIFTPQFGPVNALVGVYK